TISFGALLFAAARHYSELLGMQADSVRAYEALAVLHDLKATLDSDRGLMYCAATGNRTFMRVNPEGEGYETLYRRLLELTSTRAQAQQQLAELDVLWHRLGVDAIGPMRALCEAAQGGQHPSAREIEQVATVRNKLRGVL